MLERSSIHYPILSGQPFFYIESVWPTQIHRSFRTDDMKLSGMMDTSFGRSKIDGREG